MDTGILRGIFTAVLIVAFLGMWIWAYGSKRRARFDAAARMPLQEDFPLQGRMTDTRLEDPE